MTAAVSSDPLRVDVQRRMLAAQAAARELLAIETDRPLTVQERMGLESWYDDIGRYSTLLDALGSSDGFERRAARR